MHKVKNKPIDNDDIVNKEYVDANSPNMWKGTLAEFNTAKANGEITPGMIVYITNDTTVFDSQDIYDTYEVETNKCFMGKTVYRRVYKTGTIGSSSNRAFNIANLERLVYVGGTFRNGTYDYPIPYVNHSNVNNNVSVNCSLNSSGGYVYLYTGSAVTITDGYIVIEYTKF